MISIEPLKKQMRDARHVLWWALLLELTYSMFSLLTVPFNVFSALVFFSAVVLILFYYILFLGFSKMFKHFHSMHLFWLLFMQFSFDIFFTVVDVSEKFTYYGEPDVVAPFISGVIVLFGAVLTFLYGYFIMELPHRKFGPLLFRIRAANISKAIFMALLVYFITTGGDEVLTEIFLFANFILIFVTTYYDFRLMTEGLRLIGGLLPHKAPRPHDTK